jgi:hypothetical protein
MSLRVVLYAEGGRDLGAATTQVAPGQALPEDALGPAHFLVRRSIEETRRIPEAAIRFEAPLRTPRGIVAQGSHLLDRKTLRQLLTWVHPARRPDLAVVLVDADGDTDRRRALVEVVADLPMHPVIGVARQEFEAWLVADASAVRAAIGRAFDLPEDPERLPPREAKQRLDAALGGSATPLAQHREKRLQIAQGCDLAILRRRCAAYREFLEALVAG